MVRSRVAWCLLGVAAVMTLSWCVELMVSEFGSTSRFTPRVVTGERLDLVINATEYDEFRALEPGELMTIHPPGVDAVFVVRQAGR